jgi:hypothetical protein
MTHASLLDFTSQSLARLLQGRDLILDDAGRYFWRAGQDSEKIVSVENFYTVERMLLALVEDDTELIEAVDSLTVIAISLLEDALAITHPQSREGGSYVDNFSIDRSLLSAVADKYSRSERIFEAQKTFILSKIDPLLHPLACHLFDELALFGEIFQSEIVTGSGTVQGGAYRVIITNTLLRERLHFAMRSSQSTILS